TDLHFAVGAQDGGGGRHLRPHPRRHLLLGLPHGGGAHRPRAPPHPLRPFSPPLPLPPPPPRREGRSSPRTPRPAREPPRACVICSAREGEMAARHPGAQSPPRGRQRARPPLPTAPRAQERDPRPARLPHELRALSRRQRPWLVARHHIFHPAG